ARSADLRRIRRPESGGRQRHGGGPPSEPAHRDAHHAEVSGRHTDEPIPEPTPCAPTPDPDPMARMLTLHHLNNSRSQRILWLLEELGAPYEIERYQRNAETRRAPPGLKPWP